MNAITDPKTLIQLAEKHGARIDAGTWAFTESFLREFLNDPETMALMHQTPAGMKVLELYGWLCEYIGDDTELDDDERTAILHPNCEDLSNYQQDDNYRVTALFRGVAPAPIAEHANFQTRVEPWLIACFGKEIADDFRERNHRFFEESTELVQACGMTSSEAHQLVDYTFGRPIGEKKQETGGVMVTLAALCRAQRIDMHECGEIELSRINTPENTEKIRAKQAAKPKHSPLPAYVTPTEQHCLWKYDGNADYDAWESACGQSWTFIEGSPQDNGIRFCQHCGKSVVFAPTSDSLGVEV